MGCAKIFSETRTIWSVILVCCAALLSGCVSSTLDSARQESIASQAITNTTQPALEESTGAPTTFEKNPETGSSELALTRTNSQRILTREEGIKEIHRKAAAAPKNTEAPDLGNPRQGAAEIRSNEVVNANIAELNNRTQASKAQLPDKELQANQRSMADLRRKAKIHYDSAVKNIETTE